MEMSRLPGSANTRRSEQPFKGRKLQDGCVDTCLGGPSPQIQGLVQQPRAGSAQLRSPVPVLRRSQEVSVSTQPEVHVVI